MNVEQAAKNLIAECNHKDVGWHAIYIQSRIDRNATVKQVLMVHVRPGAEHLWRNREQHFGFPVEVHPWDKDDPSARYIPRR